MSAIALRLAVALELGTLMRRDGILDRQLVEIERARHGLELLVRRLVEPQPRQGRTGLAGREEIIERREVRIPHPLRYKAQSTITAPR